MAQKPILIGISGGSGSGKSTLASALYEALGAQDSVLISEDDYYKDTSKMEGFNSPGFNFDDPIIRDHGLLFSHLNDFAQNIPFEKPLYDFTNHCRKRETETIFPARYWIMEGTHVFVDVKICEFLDYKIFVDTSEDERLKRRLKRDVEERGRTQESVHYFWENFVRPSHQKWTEPTRLCADLIVENSCADSEGRKLQINGAIVAILAAIGNKF